MAKALQDRLVWAAGIAMVALMAAKLGAVWQGGLTAQDDYMRLQQVRDLLAGQAWFNVGQSRFLTPEGGDMHWSRLPDIFIGGLVLFFDLFTDRATAERLTAIVWPLTLLSALLSTLAVTVRRIGGGRAGIIAAFFLFGTSASSLQYLPGRIDHHGLIALLLLTAVNALMNREASPKSGLVAAAALCAALSVAIESLPFTAVLIAAFGLLWVVRGHLEAPRLAAFGAGLAVLGLVFYILDAPGLGAARAVCDAFGQGHMTALAIGGVGLAWLGVFGGALASWQVRLLAAAALGALVLIAVWQVAPACFGSPYRDISDLMNEMWLSRVGEARSLPALWSASPNVVIAGFGVAVAALAAAIWMRVRASEESRLSWTVLSALIIVGIALTSWQIRALTMTHILASAAGGAAIGLLFSQWIEKRGVPPLLMLAAAAFALSPVTWSRIGAIAAPDPVEAQEEGTPRALCYTPSAYAPLRTLEPAAIFSQIDLGPPILAHTDHSILSAPYHRNLQGIEDTLTIFLGSSDEALTRLNEKGAAYVLACPAAERVAGLAERAPAGFSADMQNDRRPDWLQPVELDGLAPLELYRITDPD